MKDLIKLIFIPIIISITGFTKMNAQLLTNKEKSIVTISAQTAKGNLMKLKVAFNEGLDNGLTVNEIKEILIQLAAYCGFPRSLNGINTFSMVVDERKSKGITDSIGAEPTSLGNAADKYQIGKANLERLTGRTENGPKTGYAAFVPVIDTFLKEHLFADIFSRGVLTDQERELITISALTSLGNVDAQLQGHLSISMHIGLSKSQIEQMFAIIEAVIGKKEADEGRKVLSKLVK